MDAAVSEAELENLARRLGEQLLAAGLILACAESCTGGWASQLVTSVAGSSAWFDRGFVTYSNEAKIDMLGVSPETLARHGAVSEETAQEMARGALVHSRADLALAITGIAGPGGGSADKPVGTVCFAWAHRRNGEVFARSEHLLFGGSRSEVRAASVRHALLGLDTHL